MLGCLLSNAELLFGLHRAFTLIQKINAGPIYSWDRIPYATTVRDGTTSSITPGWITVSRNLIVANYNAGWAVDNDDGSSYWKTTENVLAYGHSGGLKSDFGGHDLRHMRNLYLFPTSCAVLAMGMDSFFMVSASFCSKTSDLINSHQTRGTVC